MVVCYNPDMNFKILLCLLAFATCKWQTPFKIGKADWLVAFKATYLDTSTGTLHMVYTTRQLTEKSIFYLNVKSNGTATLPKPISNLHQSLMPNEVAITGPSDGKHIYIVMTQSRENVGDEVYFTESEDDGVTWKEPTLPRPNNLEDLGKRNRGTLLLTQNGRLYIAYNIRAKNNINSLGFLSRSPGSILWGKESIFTYPGFSTIHDIKRFSIASISSPQNTLLFYIIGKVNDTYMPLMGESQDLGNTWTVYVINKYHIFMQEMNTLLGTNGNNIYGAHFVDLGNGWHNATVFKYGLGGVWQDIAYGRLKYPTYQNMEFIKLNGKINMIYHASLYTYKTELKPILMQIAIDEDNSIKDLPVPHPCEDSAYVQVCAGTYELIASGTNVGKHFYGQRYIFD